jgi:hypothetical protein
MVAGGEQKIVQVFDLGSRAILRNFDVSCLIFSTFRLWLHLGFPVFQASFPVFQASFPVFQVSFPVFSVVVK